MLCDLVQSDWLMVSNQSPKNPIPLCLPLSDWPTWHSNTALKSVLRHFILGGKWHVQTIFKFGLSIMQVLCPRQLIPKTLSLLNNQLYRTLRAKEKFQLYLTSSHKPLHIFFTASSSAPSHFVSFCVQTGQGFCNKPKIFTRYSVVLLWNLRLSPLSISFYCPDKFKN